MINLCDDNKYYTDASLSNSAKRSAREVEDIEIVGTIFGDESINFISLSGSCDITSIASISCSFFTPTSNLEIIGLRPDDPSNPRMPTGSALTGIETNNPIRFNHGWYSINPAFTIGSVITNGNVKATNMGYNNTRTDCNNFIADNSIIANNTLSVNSISFTNNSKAYGCAFTSSGINLSNTKIDQSNINANSGVYTGGSYLECQIFHNKLQSNNTTFINCEITTGESEFISSNLYESSLVFNISNNSSGTGNIVPGITLDNCTINGGVVNADVLYLKGGSGNESTISSNKLYAGILTFTLVNGNLNAIKVYNADINNSGSLSFGDVDSLKLINQAQVTINSLSDNPVSKITNNAGGVITISNSGYLSNGTNKGFIVGELVDISDPFSNTTSGKINTKICNLYNAVNNLGQITTANLYDASINNGYIINGKFYDTSKNLQNVNVSEFYNNSINESTGLLSQATFNDNSVNKAVISGVSIFFNNNSTNKATIYGATFFQMASHIEGACYNSTFNNNSYMGGDGLLVSGAIFNDNSQLGNSIDARDIIFNDNSSLGHIQISQHNTKIEMNNVSSGGHIEILGASGINISLNNNSFLNLIDGTYASDQSISINNNSKVNQCNGNIIVNFNDQSLCGSSEATIKLRDNAKATGTTYNTILCYDNSLFSGWSIVSGIFFNNAQIISSIISSSNFIEFNGNENKKSIQGNNIYFTNGANNSISGVLRGDRIKFLNSNNYGTINNTVVFSGSINYSFALRGESYYINSSNRGSGDKTFYFGAGSTNNGYAHTAHFYSGSSNNGVVYNGFFHNSVQSGTVLNSGMIDNSLINLSVPF